VNGRVLPVLSRFFVASVLVAACAFVALTLAAQVAVSVPHAPWIACCAASVVLAWLVFEYCSRRAGEWFRRSEVWILAAACLVAHWAIVAWLSGHGQSGMSSPGDSRASLMALESGRICHMHQARDLNWSNYEVLLSALLVYELLIGLDVKHDGRFSADFIEKVRSWDDVERMRQLRAAVRRDWRKYPKLMVRKFCNVHGSHCRPFVFVPYSAVVVEWAVRHVRRLVPYSKEASDEV
jgi:hypothetical protein